MRGANASRVGVHSCNNESSAVLSVMSQVRRAITLMPKGNMAMVARQRRLDRDRLWQRRERAEAKAVRTSVEFKKEMEEICRRRREERMLAVQRKREIEDAEMYAHARAEAKKREEDEAMSKFISRYHEACKVAKARLNIRREQVEVKRAEFAAANAGYKWVFDRPGVGPDWIEYCWAEALREIEEVALRDAGMWRFADGYLWHVCTVCGTSAACTHKLDDACDEARAFRF